MVGPLSLLNLLFRYKFAAKFSLKELLKSVNIWQSYGQES